ncbi:MAG: hypothetical protein ACI97A_004263 [Planctomycetota bacterium]|jgi:hypothetical protein
MKDTAHFAGFCAAHGILGLSQGTPIVPFVFALPPDGQPKTISLKGDLLEERVDAGRKILENPRAGIDLAVLIFDSTVNLEAGEQDAIIVEARHFGENPTSLTMAIPYVQPKEGAAFLVNRPEFIGFDGCDEDDLPRLFEPFFHGVETHPEGAAVWNAHKSEDHR